MSEDAPEVDVQITQDDIDEAKRLGLTGAEMLARAIRRQFPNATRVHVDVERGTIEVDTGEPLS